MPTSIAPPEPRPSTRRSTGYGSFDGHLGGGDSDWGGDSGGGSGASGDAYRMAVWLGLASIVMLFAGLSSAYVFRLGASLEWRTIEMPAFLLPNSCLLLASSVSLELFRRKLKRGLSANARLLLGLTVSLGVAFLSGQIWIWRTLSGQGIYLSSNPHSSFFYVMTGVHAVHLAGGILALTFLFARTCLATEIRAGLQTFADVTAIYWHFMDGLWVYLFLLLFFWR
jgi:cytochrome c oxidase subunit III